MDRPNGNTGGVCRGPPPDQGREKAMSVRAETRAPTVPLTVPKRESKLIKEQTRLAWILLSPSLLVVVLVALIPLIQTVAQSFTNARLASERPVAFVGLNNYLSLVQDTDSL